MSTKRRTDAFQPSGDVRRVQSLGGGTFVRIGDHNGRWHQLSVERDSETIWHLVTIVNADNPELAARIVGELVEVDDQFVSLWQCVDPGTP